MASLENSEQKKWHIDLSNDVQEVPTLNEFVEGICEAVEFDMGTTMKLTLAIEEAVVNVMNYAYPKGTVGSVRMDVHADDAWVYFVISDQGTPFDPTAKEEVDTTLSAEDRKIGGLGIHLVRNIMDAVSYKRIDDTNELTLGKKR